MMDGWDGLMGIAGWTAGLYRQSGVDTVDTVDTVDGMWVGG
jgi:hypothetical protein